MLLNRNSLSVAKLAPKESSRYTLDTIQVTERETVATNDRYLVRVSHPDEPFKVENWPVVPGFDGAPNGSGTFQLDAQVVLDVLKATPKKNAIPILNNAAVYQKDGETTLVVTDLASSRSFRMPKQAGQFPRWEMAFPKDDVAAEVTLDANYLAMLAKHAADFVSDAYGKPCIRIRIMKGEYKPVRFDATNTDTKQGWTALLMPIRSGGEHKYGYGMPTREEREAQEKADKEKEDAAKIADANAELRTEEHVAE
jgi:hypothetical protein